MDNYITQYIIAYNLKLNTNNHLFLKKNLKLKRIKIQPTKLHISTILLICKNNNQTNSENPLISETHNDLRLVQAGKCNRAFAIFKHIPIHTQTFANTYPSKVTHNQNTNARVYMCLDVLCSIYMLIRWKFCLYKTFWWVVFNVKLPQCNMCVVHPKM